MASRKKAGKWCTAPTSGAPQCLLWRAPGQTLSHRAAPALRTGSLVLRAAGIRPLHTASFLPQPFRKEGRWHPCVVVTSTGVVWSWDQAFLKLRNTPRPRFPQIDCSDATVLKS